MNIDNLSVIDVSTMEQDIAYGINVIQHKYTNIPNFKRKPLFLKFCNKCSQLGHSIFTHPVKRYMKSLEKPDIQMQTFNKAMK